MDNTLLRLAQIANGYMLMLERSIIDGHGNAQIIVDACLERMHDEWIEARCTLADARHYAERMIEQAARYGLQPRADEAIRAIEGLGV